MCGIIGYLGPTNPKEVLIDGLKRLEYRGYDSAGIAVRNNGDVRVFRSEGRIQNLEAKVGTEVLMGTSGIGHTRWATHGAPIEKNAHPHRVGSVTLVHNGIIENYNEHKDRLLAMGKEILSDTDSEIVAHLFDFEIQNGKTLKEALVTVLPKLRGAYAFVVMSDKEPEKIAGVRNGPPLLVGLGKDENFIASDVQAILHRTNRIVYLNDNEFALCNHNSVELFTEKGAPLPLKISQLDWSAEQMDKQGYRHYMLKEIYEQSLAVANTIAGNIDARVGVVSLPEWFKAPSLLKNTERISLVACGTAKHAALVGKYYLEKMAGIPVDVDFASEFRYRNPILDPKTLLISVSQSGETADTLAAQREGKQKKVPTLAICNVRHSTLAREADFVIYTNAGPEIGVASTKAFTTQLTVLYLLAVQLGLEKGTLKLEQAQALTSDLRKLPHLIDAVLKLDKPIQALAEKYQSESFFFFMGRGANYPIALEGALKLKEISYLHAEGYPAGELKHGPIALVDKQTVIINLCPKMEGEHETLLYEKQISNLQEVKARGGRILSVGTEGDKHLASLSESFIELPESTWALNPILMTLPLQLFAYHVAAFRGTDVDKPRNLAKSVTVE